MTEKRENVAGLETLEVQLESLPNSGQSEENKSKITKPDSNSKDRAGALLGDK